MRVILSNIVNHGKGKWTAIGHDTMTLDKVEFPISVKDAQVFRVAIADGEFIEMDPETVLIDKERTVEDTPPL